MMGLGNGEQDNIAIANSNDTIGEILFLTRLTYVMNKILKVGSKNLKVFKTIKESKLVGTLFKNSELYLNNRKSKHL